MQLLFKILLAITKTGLYVLFAELFWERSVVFRYKKITYFISSIIAAVISISNYYEEEWMVAITPIVVLLALMVLGLVTEEKRSVIQSIVGAIESYVMTFLICFIIGILLGIVAKIGFNSMHTYGKYALLIAMRILCIIFVCV